MWYHTMSQKQWLLYRFNRKKYVEMERIEKESSFIIKFSSFFCFNIKPFYFYREYLLWIYADCVCNNCHNVCWYVLNGKLELSLVVIRHSRVFRASKLDKFWFSHLWLDGFRVTLYAKFKSHILIVQKISDIPE